jgi:hypothetical protein
MWYLRKVKFMKAESRMVASRGWGRENGDILIKRHKSLIM